jgi:hypothetical protein
MCPVFALPLPLFFPGNLPNVDHFGPLYTQRPIKYFTNHHGPKCKNSHMWLRRVKHTIVETGGPIRVSDKEDE